MGIIGLEHKCAYLLTVPVGNDAGLASRSCVEGAVSMPARPVKGFNKNGAGELSGTGSTEITTVLFLTSSGKVNPSGAFSKKSSPGIGGPGFGPL